MYFVLHTNCGCCGERSAGLGHDFHAEHSTDQVGTKVEGLLTQEHAKRQRGHPAPVATGEQLTREDDQQGGHCTHSGAHEVDWFPAPPVYEPTEDHDEADDH